MSEQARKSTQLTLSLAWSGWWWHRMQDHCATM